MNYISLHSKAGGFRNQFRPDYSMLVFEATGFLPYGKVFIPPGTIRISTIFYLAEGLRIGVVARFRVHPKRDYSNLNEGNWSLFPWGNITDQGEQPGTLQDATDQDFPATAFGGHITPIDQYLRTPLTEGDWLYLMLVQVGPGSIFKFKYVVEVEPSIFHPWYNSATWGQDGDPLPDSHEEPEPEPEKPWVIQVPASWKKVVLVCNPPRPGVPTLTVVTQGRVKIEWNGGHRNEKN